MKEVHNMKRLKFLQYPDGWLTWLSIILYIDTQKKGSGFDSQSEHKPRLWVRSPLGIRMRDN